MMTDMLGVKTAAHLQRLKDSLARARATRWAKRGRRHLNDVATQEALACAKRALSLCANHEGAYALMAQALMPGDDYTTLLARFHDLLQPESYVEIGVSSGRSLALVRPGTKAIGIDPAPRINKTISSGTSIYPVTSDEFFARHDLLRELGTPRLSLAFIDGLHQAGQVLRDFVNLERYADEHTVILIHDCLPLSASVASPTRKTKFWCGDVWKVIPALQAYRPDLRLCVILTRPSGLDVVTNLDPHATVLSDNFSRLTGEYEAQAPGYEYFDFIQAMFTDVIPNDWGQIVQTIFPQGWAPPKERS